MSGGETLYHIIHPNLYHGPLHSPSEHRQRQAAGNRWNNCKGINKEQGNALKPLFQNIVQFTPNGLAFLLVSCNACSSQERRIVSKYHRCTSDSFEPSTVAYSANRLLRVVCGIIFVCYDLEQLKSLYFKDSKCRVWKLGCIYSYTCIT